MADDSIHRLADLFDPGDVVMLTTHDGGRVASRPMTVAGVEGSRLSFLVDKTADWYPPLAQAQPSVHVTLSDVHHNDYAALNGDTRVSEDHAEIALLWSPAASAFFDGENDPKIAVLHVTATDGEYWDGPSGRIGSLITMVAAKVSGDHSAGGDHGAIAT